MVLARLQLHPELLQSAHSLLVVVGGQAFLPKELRQAFHLAPRLVVLQVQSFNAKPIIIDIKRGEQFLVIDNFDETQSNDDKDFFVNYPVKISFSIAIFCVAGEIRFRINLQEYMFRANDLLVVMEGNIGEFIGMNDDAKMAVIAFGDNYFKGTIFIEETMLLEQRLHASPLCHLIDNARQECLAIYRLAKAKIAETDNPFRRGALMGYAQVLTNNAYYYLSGE